jgi:hypothetical protein
VAAIVFEASLTVVRDTLARLVYTPAPNFHGRDVLTVTVTRAGAAGTQDLADATSALASAPFPLLQFSAACPGVVLLFLDVASVNDAPVVLVVPGSSAPGPVPGVEDVWGPGPVFSVSDVDVNDAGGKDTGVLSLLLSTTDGDLRLESSLGLHVWTEEGGVSPDAFLGFDTSLVPVGADAVAPALAPPSSAAPRGVSRLLALQGTAQHLNAALASLQFRGAPNWSGEATVTALVRDGAGSRDVVTTTVVVAPVDDALQIVFTPGSEQAFTLPAVAIGEDEPLVFDPNPNFLRADGSVPPPPPASSSLANPSSTVALQLVDVDSSSLDVATVRVWTDSGFGRIDLGPTGQRDVRVLVNRATLVLGGGVDGQAGDGPLTPACEVVFQGTFDAVNAALAGLTYTPPTNAIAQQLIRVAVYGPGAANLTSDTSLLEVHADGLASAHASVTSSPQDVAHFGDAIADGSVSLGALVPLVSTGLHVVIRPQTTHPW